MIYRMLMGVAILVAAFVLFFFLWNLGFGGVHGGDLLLWLPLTGFAVGIPIVAAKLRGIGQNPAAIVLLLVSAIPAFLFALILLAFTISPPRWN